MLAGSHRRLWNSRSHGSVRTRSLSSSTSAVTNGEVDGRMKIANALFTMNSSSSTGDPVSHWIY